MGINTIRNAKRIVLLAWGINKAKVIKETIEGEITSQIPASYLQNHKNTTFIIDVEASTELTRIKTPWLVASCVWTDELKKESCFLVKSRSSKANFKTYR